MTPRDLARLHGLCFDHAPRPWSEQEFAEFCADPNVTLTQVPHGFALSRTIAGEADLLTLAVHPDHRRKGIAAALLGQHLAALIEKGATTVFLEVAVPNAAARALYARAGFAQMGLRKGYFAGTDAMTLRKSL